MGAQAPPVPFLGGRAPLKRSENDVTVIVTCTCPVTELEKLIDDLSTQVEILLEAISVHHVATDNKVDSKFVDGVGSVTFEYLQKLLSMRKSDGMAMQKHVADCVSAHPKVLKQLYALNFRLFEGTYSNLSMS